MESTIPAATSAVASVLVVSAPSLAAAFTRMPDPRRAKSVAYPLAAVLTP